MTDIFISYSHKDEAWKDKLQAPLRALQLHNDFDVWDDRQIGLGDNWLPEIEKAIEQARVAVLLVSNDFLMSDFVVQQEIPRLLQRRAEEGLCVVPVVVRPCPWQGVSWLAELQGATKDNKPLSSLQGEHEQEDVLSKVAMKIFGLLNDNREQEQQQIAARKLALVQEEERKREEKRKKGQLLRERKEKEQREQARLIREQEEEKLRSEEREAQQRILAAKVHEQASTKPQLQSNEAVNQQKTVQFDNRKAGLSNNVWLGIAGVVLLGVAYAANTTGMFGKLLKPGLAKIIDLPHNMKLVKIPRGSFQMGSDNGSEDEQPVHTVTLDYDFWMSQTEVTFTQYDAYAEAIGKEKPSDNGWGRKDRPVINVSWNDTLKYVKWLSTNNDQGLQCRLPNEAEWEYSARAGSSTNYSWGNDIGKNKANCIGCGSQWDNKQTAPVGSFPKNKFDLHDTHGNVWEWVQDRWHGNYQGAPVDGTGWGTGDKAHRVLRGGSWISSPNSLRSALRYYGYPGSRFYGIGFRIVCSLPSMR